MNIKYLVFTILLPAIQCKGTYCESEYCQPTWTPIPNLGAALVGYNPIIGNSLIKGNSDPGLRGPIFTPTYKMDDGRYNLNSFIHAEEALNCQVNGQTDVVKSYEDYRKKKSGSYSFTEHGENMFDMNLPFFSWLINFDYSESKIKSTEETRESEREMKFFRDANGEIYINQAKCETHRIVIDNFEPPIFSAQFLSGMRRLHKAAANPTSNKSKRFISTFGTHYMAESWLGASFTSETRFSSASRNSADQKNRADCVKKAFEKGLNVGVKHRDVDLNLGVQKGGVTGGASTTYGGWGLNSKNQYKNLTRECSDNQKQSDFFFANQFERTKFVTKGSPPFENTNEWEKMVGKNPIVVRFKLNSIANLFDSAWVGDIPLEEDNLSAGNFDFQKMKHFFLAGLSHYCELMLDRECEVARGCGYLSKSLCTEEQKCIVSNNTLGFECLQTDTYLFYVNENKILRLPSFETIPCDQELPPGRSIQMASAGVVDYKGEKELMICGGFSNDHQDRYSDCLVWTEKGWVQTARDFIVTGGGASSVLFGDRMLVTGGFNSTSAWLYKPTEGRKSFPFIPRISNFHCQITINDTTFIIGGGHFPSGIFKDPIIRSEVYKSNGGSWVPLTSMRSPRMSHACVEWKQNILVIGGSPHDFDKISVEIYDIATDSWSPFPPVPENSKGLKAIVYQNNVYVFLRHRLYRMGPDTNTWEIVPDVYDLPGVYDWRFSATLTLKSLHCSNLGTADLSSLRSRSSVRTSLFYFYPGGEK